MSMKILNLLKGRRVVLASNSPRRKELLSMICADFEVCAAKGEEIPDESIDCYHEAEYLALQKCREVAKKYPEDTIVIAGDTTVILDGKILGKPKDSLDAARMLRLLSGKTHDVVSGVALSFRGEERTFSERTSVTFCRLNEDDIAAYTATGEPLDKAGAYGIQGLGSLLCSRIEGDYFAVVGLPISRLADKLEKLLK